MHSSLIELEDFLVVLERRPEHMERTHGEYSEFINSKKSSNLSYVNPKRVKKSLKE
jgi:hypothetical protein